MKEIIKRISKEIASEIITRPNFDLEEVAAIVNFRINDSIIEILMSNVEKEELNYNKLLLQQSQLKLGSKEYVSLGYQLAIAKNKKSIANRSLNNAKGNVKSTKIMEFIRNKFPDFDMGILYDYLDNSEVQKC